MKIRLHSCSILSAICVHLVSGTLVRADDSKSIAIPPQGRKAVERGLDFLQKDAAKWRAEKHCATCHHGTMTVWALCEAKSQGYAVTAGNFGDMVQWTKERLKDIDKPRDTRPGWSMVCTPALYLSVMTLGLPKQDAIPAADLKRIAGHLVRHQEKDGSWAWSSAPPKNRPPPVFESDEVATLLAVLGLTSQVSGKPNDMFEVRSTREKASSWLAKTKPTDTTQAAALRLFVKAREGPAQDLRADVEAFLALQNRDGGWGQVKGAASDAYATGQALYVLSLVGVSPDRGELQRGVTFLVNTQKENGSWPMTGRAHPGATPSTNLVTITYFGSTWATLGLMRTVAK